MKLPAWLARWVAREQPKRHGELVFRGYDAARTRRSGWSLFGSATSANAETAAALDALRANSEELVRNNPHAAKLIQILTNNSVGFGITPTVKTGSAELDALCMALWSEWGQVADADGVLDIYGCMQIAVRGMFQGGETLTRRRRRRISDGLPIPLQLQILEGAYLDGKQDGETPDGERVVQGIQVSRIGRRVAYWLFEEHPGDFGARRRQKVASRPILAEDIIHLYEVQRPGQMRGVPWMAPIMVPLAQLDEWEEAERVRKRTEACIAFLVIGDDENEQSVGFLFRDSRGEKVEAVEPGMIAYSSAARDVKSMQPTAVPNYGEYKKSALMSLAAGGRVTYELLAGDLSEVNYSSFKAGANEFRRMIESLQWLTIIPRWCDTVWGWFIEAAIVSGKLPDRDYPVTWAEPKMQSIEPDKDVKADLDEVNGGLADLRMKIAARGYDPDRTLRDIAETRKLLKSLDLEDLIPTPARVTKQGPTPAAEPAAAKPKRKSKPAAPVTAKEPADG